jgi:hypothetical protein
MDPRLKGQEISIRVTENGVVTDTLDSITTFNDEMKLETKEDGFLGERTNRFDEILNGYGGDFEMHTAKASWIRFQQAIADRATRRKPNTVFNVIRTDLFANGSSLVFTYADVKWGAQPTSVGGRGEFVKVKAGFVCSERHVIENAI